MASTTKIVLGRVVPSLAVVAAAGVALLYGVQMARTSAEREIYRDRLRDIANQYEELRGLYNDAVRKTAVTELIVDEGRVTVRVRTAEGVLTEIETPYDASREIYLDYAVLDGRVWIRRVFDDRTAPSEATVIDPRLAAIDWDLSGAEVGKAVYRSLADGRWVVSVTGNGSLGLVKLADDAGEIELAAAPATLEFGEVEEQIQAELDRVKMRDLWAQVTGN
ncbi:MAG: hypothetical protein DHS20C14_08490 [Phycisphaeraceae bacterium]|nr:MAG: hypothetical protein DHS20C14_08490 [Phycisphaeraceae bacterium]